MKHILLAASLTMALIAGNALAEEPKSEFKEPKDKTSYAIGVDIAKNLSRQQLDLNPEMLAAGIRDALSGGAMRLTDQEVRETLMALQKEMFNKMHEKMLQEAEKNRREGEAFLAENKKKKDVVTTQSGLQYKIITKGTGKIPKETNLVTAHYKGTLIDGTEFDSSYKRGEPTQFPVNGVIKGWQEALQLMPVGSKWQLFIPADLAYGEQGAGRAIGPNATLLFEVELISIDDKER